MKKKIEQTKASCERALNEIIRHSGKDTLVSLNPFNASTKPCHVAGQIADKNFKALYAPIMPLDGCIDPSKCACVYSVVPFPES